jgi:hypothetical protein
MVKKCSECEFWDTKEGDCNAIPTDLGSICLLRHILWEIEFLGGLVEDKNAEKDDGEDWWKNNI